MSVYISIKTLPSPEYLLSNEGQDALMALLLEKDQDLRALKARDFGLRVTDGETAQHFLSKVSESTRKVLDLQDVRLPEPELILRHNLSRLPKQTLKAYLYFVPLCLLLAMAAAAQGFGTPLTLIVFSVLGLLLVIPVLVHRRNRLHLEHGCHYVRTGDGKGTIVVDELHSLPFQSYLAHEYAHHLLLCLNGETKDPRIKEGWARLVQWRVVSDFSEKEGNPAFLYHTLFQIVSELKFLCSLLARFRHKKLPRKIRRIRSMYHFNPLYRLVTGTPGVHMGKLVEHAVGTALFFLESRERGAEEVLLDLLFAAHGPLPSPPPGGEYTFANERTQ
jgi:hypothetical protein